MRTSNPVFRSLENTQSYEAVEGAASYRGISFKTLTLLLTAVASGFFFISYASANNMIGFLIGSMIVAFIAVMIGVRSVNLAMPMGLIYALAEGVLLGTITALVEIYAPGIAFTALIGTATIFIVMLFLYSSRIIRVTSRLRKVIYGSLLAALVMMIIFGILSYATNIYATVPVGLALGVTGLLIVLGAFMLTLDFERAEAIVSGGYDKRYEWMVAIGLMVTIVWIYIELIRFLLILASRNR